MYKLVSTSKDIYSLVVPYGKVKLAFVFLVALLQGLFQVVGVSSVFPFLALAANPSAFLDSRIGHTVQSIWPAVSEQNLLIGAGIFAITMLTFSNATLLFGEVVRTRYVQGLGHWLRTRLLTRMISNHYGYFLNQHTGELIKKTSGDVMTFVNSVLAPFMDMIARGIMIVFLVIVLLIFDPILTLYISLTLAIFYISIYKILTPLRNRTSDGLKEANRGAMKQTIQILHGIKPIKIHSAEIPFLKHYGVYSARQASLSKWIPVLTHAPRYLIEPLAFGSIISVVLFYTMKGEPLQNVLPVLGVMAFAGYRLLPNIQMIYGSLSGISATRHALEEIQQELKNYTDSLNKETFIPAHRLQPMNWQQSIRIEIESFSYKKASKLTLDNINLSLKKNKFYAFIGGTGSGKSTLIDLLMGLHWPQEGGIYVDGKKLTPENIRSWRIGVGYVPQDIFLIDDSIKANIAFGIEAEFVNDKHVQEVAEIAQIWDFIKEELPQGLETKVGERGVRLSGGQKQRIGLARALYHKPSLLVLDEATSALDEDTERALIKAIDNMQGQITLIAVAHRMTTIERADKVFCLKKGKLEKSGSFHEMVQ